MLRTKVKASAINNLTDARYFAAFEVEWLGFQLDPAGERHVQPQVLKAIREWVDGVKIVGEFEMQSAADIQTAMQMLQLDAVQAGMLTTVETLIELRSQRPVIKEVVVETDSSMADLQEILDQFAPHCAWFVLNFDKNGISWDQLQAGLPGLQLREVQSLCAQYPILLSLDLKPDALTEVMDVLSPAGFSFTGGEEERVGYKSFDELDELLEQLILEE
jgi:phosphoribosylanthranilate isomerase